MNAGECAAGFYKQITNTPAQRQRISWGLGAHCAHIKLIAVAILVCVIVVVGYSVTIHQTLINTREHLSCIHIVRLCAWTVSLCASISVPSYSVVVGAKVRCCRSSRDSPAPRPIRRASINSYTFIDRFSIFRLSVYSALVTKSHAGQSAIEKTRLSMLQLLSNTCAVRDTYTHANRFNALHWWIGLSPRGYHGYKILWPLSTCVCVCVHAFP